MNALRTGPLFVTLWVGLLISACDQLPRNDSALEDRLQKADAALEVRLKKADGALEDRLQKAENDLASLRKELDALKSERDWDSFTKDLDKLAYLTPGAEGYSTLVFDLGVLTVQLSDVKPYANGSKVTITFGNTLSSSIDGLKATVDWGRVGEKGFPEPGSTKTKDMTFIQSLPGGRWTPIEVVLDGIPPAELGFVRVKNVHHTGIRLHGENSR